MQRRLAWGAWVVLLLEAALVSAAHGRPEGNGAEPSRSGPVVELVIVGGGTEALAVIGAVSELLGGIGVAAEAHAVATPADVLGITRGSAVARVQVDLRDPDQAEIVTEGRGQPPSRRTLHRDRSVSVAREEIAQAIESAVQAQLMGEQRGEAPTPIDAGAAAPVDSPGPPAPSTSTPAPPAMPADPPLVQPPVLVAAEHPPASAPVSPLALDVAALAGAGWFTGSTGPVADVGGDVSLQWRRGWRPSLSLAVRALLPFDASAEAVTAHTSALATRALVGLELVRARWVSLTAGGGGGADVLWVQPQSPSLAPSVLGPSTTNLDPIITAFVATHVALAGSVSLTLVLTGDVDLAPTQFLVAQGGSREAALAPWPVRPTLLAGFTFTTFGEPDFVSGGQR
jgi:hypothetical protein